MEPQFITNTGKRFERGGGNWMLGYKKDKYTRADGIFRFDMDNNFVLIGENNFLKLIKDYINGSQDKLAKRKKSYKVNYWK